METFFSIIIPTYNRAHLIESTVKCVLHQTYTNFELIIVDDGSTDNTKQIVERLIENNQNKKIIYIQQVNSERAVARNNGLKKSKGDYVIYFDSDDELYENHLNEANNFICNNNFPEIFHLRYDIKNGKKIKFAEAPIYLYPPKNELIFGNFLSCNGVVLKKEIAFENQFNEDRNLSAVEDWELWLRLSVKYDIHYINTITSSIFNHDERSVFIVNKDKLILRFETLMGCVLSNNEITNYYKKDLNKFKSSCYSYISLHLALTKQYRRAVFIYLIKSIIASPIFIFKKRFFGILKHFI